MSSQGEHVLAACAAAAAAPTKVLASAASEASLVRRGFRLDVKAAADLSTTERAAVFALFAANMRAQYERNWGWEPRKKRRELFGLATRFILATELATAGSGGSGGGRCNRRSSARRGGLAAFTSFRFEPDDPDHPQRAALYTYELQVAATCRRLGLGMALMTNLEAIAAQLPQISSIMLTVFKTNGPALALYTKALGYAVDATSPSRLGHLAEAYEVLSKPVHCVCADTPATSLASSQQQRQEQASAAVRRSSRPGKGRPPKRMRNEQANAAPAGQASSRRRRQPSTGETANKRIRLPKKATSAAAPAEAARRTPCPSTEAPQATVV